jgi:hypothetical protein
VSVRESERASLSVDFDADCVRIILIRAMPLRNAQDAVVVFSGCARISTLVTKQRENIPWMSLAAQIYHFWG